LSSVWATLSAIDCNKHVEKKGQFSYLSWTWAWAMVKDQYPLARYDICDDKIFSDGSMEVRMEITIPTEPEYNEVTGEGTTAPYHMMWLPVLDFKNNAIKNPDAMAINTARMRCLVKCCAMHGLGHYIYSGESTPQEAVIEETKPMALAGAELNRCFESDDYHGAAQIYEEWSHAENSVICRARANGGQLSPANRVKLKSTEFRLALNEARGIEMSKAL
jgi:hypothetical protein